MQVLRLSRSDFSRERALQMYSLWEEVWPNKEGASVEEQVEHFFQDDAAEHRIEPGSELLHVVERDGKVVAVAWSYVRQVCFDALQRKAPVLALAGVCSSPRERGCGYGRDVVLDVFARLSDQLPWCLFQTGVPEFYERLGAYRVENEFGNRFAEDPQASPWWDKCVMVFGSNQKWPAGRVDLCGVGY